MKTYVVLGGGGVFGVHTSKYLLDHANPKKVISVGRTPAKSEPFTLNVGKGDPRYEPLARGMAAALPSIDVFLSGHNLESLEELSAAIGA